MYIYLVRCAAAAAAAAAAHTYIWSGVNALDLNAHHSTTIKSMQQHAAAHSSSVQNLIGFTDRHVTPLRLKSSCTTTTTTDSYTTLPPSLRTKS